MIDLCPWLKESRFLSSAFEKTRFVGFLISLFSRGFFFHDFVLNFCGSIWACSRHVPRSVADEASPLFHSLGSFFWCQSHCFDCLGFLLFKGPLLGNVLFMVLFKVALF